MYTHILVPVDGSELSLKALDQAAMLAGALKLPVTVITVPPVFPPLSIGDGFMPDAISPSQWETGVAIYVQRVREAVEKRAHDDKLPVEFIAVPAAAPHIGIIESARINKCDLIVMSSHGRSGFAAALLGSVTAKVLALSTLPVLVCR